MKNLYLWFSLTIFIYTLNVYAQSSFFVKNNPVPNAVSSQSQLIFMGDDIRQGEKIWNGVKNRLDHIDILNDWLQKESLFLLDYWSNAEFSKKYLNLNSEQQREIDKKLENEYRNTVLDEDGRLVLSRERVEAINFVHNHYLFLFSDDLKDLITDANKLRKVMSYLFWESWLVSSKKPADKYWLYKRQDITWLIWGGPSLFILIITTVVVILLRLNGKKAENSYTKP